MNLLETVTGLAQKCPALTAEDKESLIKTLPQMSEEDLKQAEQLLNHMMEKYAERLEEEAKMWQTLAAKYKDLKMKAFRETEAKETAAEKAEAEALIKNL